MKQAGVVLPALKRWPFWLPLLGLLLAMFTVVYSAQIVWQRRVLGVHAAHRRRSARLTPS